jgi:hypothetical protein
MNDLVVKSVDLFGDSVMAAKDKEGNIWAGVSWFCNALGMTKGQKDKQVQNVQIDEVLQRGATKLEAGVFDPNNETVALRIDFVPIWLTKININGKTKKENPELADKLLQYQLKAKDILADAFLPKAHTEPANVNPVDVPLGELASYLKIMDRIAHRQNLSPHRIAANFKKVSEQFGVELTEDFVKVPEFEQLTIESMGR